MNPLIQEGLGALIRWALAIAAGYVVKAGIWSSEDAERYVAAAALGILALGWSWWQKHRSRLKLVQALAAPKGTTEAQVEQMIKDPNTPTPPVTLAKTAKASEAI